MLVYSLINQEKISLFLQLDEKIVIQVLVNTIAFLYNNVETYQL